MVHFLNLFDPVMSNLKKGVRLELASWYYNNLEGSMASHFMQVLYSYQLVGISSYSVLSIFNK